MSKFTSGKKYRKTNPIKNKQLGPQLCKDIAGALIALTEEFDGGKVMWLRPMDVLQENFRSLAWRDTDFDGRYFEEKEPRIIKSVKLCYLHYDQVTLPVKEKGIKTTKTFENVYLTVPFYKERFKPKSSSF